MAGGLFVLPKMHKITQNSLLKKHGIFCLTFSNFFVGFLLTKPTIHGNIIFAFGTRDAFAHGEMAEWSKAPVLKTGDVKASVGSNPTLSAN